MIGYKGDYNLVDMERKSVEVEFLRKGSDELLERPVWGKEWVVHRWNREGRFLTIVAV